MTRQPRPITFEFGPLAAVTHEPAEGRWTLVFERRFGQSVERVWDALTQPRQLAAWAPFESDRDLAAVGPAVLTMIDGDQRHAIPIEVRVSDAPKVLEYTWGPDVLRWELAAVADGTRLTPRHTVDDRAAMAKMAAGWHLCLGVAERLLAGDPVPPIRGEAARQHGFDALNDAYGRELDR